MRYLGGRWPLPAVLLLAIGLVLAGCGSDTPAEADLDPTTVPPPAASEQQPVSPTATPAAAAPPTGDSAPTTTPLIATPPPESPDAPPAETATPRPSKPKPTPSPNRDLGYTERVTMTRAVDSRQRPTDSAAVFGEDERVYVSVEFLGVRSSAVLGVRWLRGSTESFVYEMEPTEAFSRGFFAFFFDPGGPGSAGPYGVEILINGEVVATASFEIRAGGGSGGPAG